MDPKCSSPHLSHQTFMARAGPYTAVSPVCGSGSVACRRGFSPPRFLGQESSLGGPAPCKGGFLNMSYNQELKMAMSVNSFYKQIWYPWLSFLDGGRMKGCG